MKRLLLVAALLMLAAFLFGGVALAATDPIVCNMEVTPSTLSAPGEVTVTITISNSGDTDMQDPLTLYSPTSKIVTDFGDNGSVTLKAGEVKTWTGKWDVNQRTLDNGQIVFFVKYTQYKSNGEKESMSQPIRGKLNATEAKTDIEIKRTISPGTAREGQTVTVKYDIVNTGTVSLKNIVLVENKTISKKSVTVAKELKAGETAQVKFPVTMGKKDLTSSATITYTTGDSTEKQTQTVEEQKITYGEAALTAKLTSSSKGVAVNGTVTLSLELKNEGNVNYTDVRVSDATLGDVFTNQELAAGGTLKLDKELTLTQTTDYQFHIVAIDNTGTEVTLDSDAITVTAVDPSKIVHLNVTVAADRTEVYEQPGIVRFTVTVENDSEVDATDVMLYHGSTRIYTFPSIPAGQSRKLTRDAALSMAGKYQFTAVTVDALENSNKFASNEIQIAFSVPTPAPATPTPPLVPTPEPTYAAVTVAPISDPSVGTLPKLVRSVFYPMMLIGIALLLGAGVLLAIATKKRIEQKKLSDAALDHLDRAKRRDYAAPSEEPEDDVPPPVKPAVKPPVSAAGAKARDEAPKAQADEDVELPHMKYVRNAYQRNSKAQTDSFGKSSLFDEDPTLSGGLHGDTAQDDVYHTYGSDQDFYANAATQGKPAAKAAAKPKDWSAYAKRPDATADAKPDYTDPGAAYRSEAGYAQDDAGYAEGYAEPAAYADAETYPEGTAYADGTVYPEDAAYADATVYPAYDAYAASGDPDAYTGETADFVQQDGYVPDPLGYGDQGGYTDGQSAYDESACYYGTETGEAGYTDGYEPGYGAADAGYSAGQAGESAGYEAPADTAATPRTHRRNGLNRGDRG